MNQVYKLDIESIFNKVAQLSDIETTSDNTKKTTSSTYTNYQQRCDDFDMKKFKTVCSKHDFERNINKDMKQESTQEVKVFDDMKTLLNHVDDNYDAWISLAKEQQFTLIKQYLKKKYRAKGEYTQFLQKYQDMLENDVFMKRKTVLYDYRKRKIIKFFV